MDITQEFLLEHFDYRNGEFYWKKPLSARVKVGDRAGTNDKFGYRQIGIKGKIYREHRLVWLYHCGKWPEKFIDHINGIKWDNRIENLREAGYHENNRNRPAQKDQRFKGVIKTPTGKYAVSIRVEGKQKYIGAFLDEITAAEAYDKAAREYFGEFAYTNFV